MKQKELSKHFLKAWFYDEWVTWLCVCPPTFLSLKIVCRPKISISL